MEKKTFRRDEVIRILTEIDLLCKGGDDEEVEDFSSMDNEQLGAELCLSGYVHDAEFDRVVD